VCDYVEPMRKHWLTFGLTLIVCAGGCVTIPKGQYGVTDIDWTGMHEMSDEALEACLVTRQRDATVLRLGVGAGKCGEPPFDSSPPKVTLWTLPWTEWPVYDPAIFDVDKQRILRWYRARGFYDARVLGVRTYVDGEMVADPVECDATKSSCKLEVMVQIDEGNPVYINDVQIETKAAIGTDILEKIRKSLTVKLNERFDEHDYETDKAAILEELWDASFARAKVTGRVSIDRDSHTASVTYDLEPGPACTFGTLHVEGADNVPELLIIQAADIREGKPYSHAAVLDAETAIFALGAFSAVQVTPQGEGSRVDLIAKVRVGRLVRWSGGVGVMSGTQYRSLESSSVPQWDIHLSGAWEHRNLFGGLRKLRIEERPRLIFLDDFPGIGKGGPKLGNLVSLKFEQPGLIERRTVLFFENTWDFGPDPFKGYFRHDITTKVGVTRPFFRQRVSTEFAIAHDLYDITDSKPPDDVSSYKLPYLEQQLIIDLRNDRARPRYGAYAGVLVQEAFRLGDYGSWDYIRVTPEIRGYVPLMWGFVLAARFAVGATFISSRDPDLDDDSQKLGPFPYRLRGGGANSNRGFKAGELGAGTDGGIRRYESSLELRIPFGRDVGMVLFGDIGDVNRGKRIRFDHTNGSLGFGLRYFTILGAIRFDAGWQIPGWQRIGDSDEPSNDVSVHPWPSAAHLTIGEAF
jgi:outer membrane protein assembly factor BamA